MCSGFFPRPPLLTLYCDCPGPKPGPTVLSALRAVPSGVLPRHPHSPQVDCCLNVFGCSMSQLWIKCRLLLCHFVPSQQPATPTRTIAATPIQTLPQSQTTPKRIDTPSLEEPSDLEELEQFAKTFKQRRIKLGFTQVGGAPSASLQVWV